MDVTPAFIAPVVSIRGKSTRLTRTGVATTVKRATVSGLATSRSEAPALTGALRVL